MIDLFHTISLNHIIYHTYHELQFILKTTYQSSVQNTLVYICKFVTYIDISMNKAYLQLCIGYSLMFVLWFEYIFNEQFRMMKGHEN